MAAVIIWSAAVVRSIKFVSSGGQRDINGWQRWNDQYRLICSSSLVLRPEHPAPSSLDSKMFVYVGRRGVVTITSAEK